MIAPARDLEERLEITQPLFRSRGEQQVSQLLKRYGIPFVYEQPTLIYDRGRYRIWHPDFTLTKHRNLIVEYAGMPDVPDYMAGIRHKQQVFAANNIPAVFIYPQDLSSRHWPYQVISRINQAYRQAIQREHYRLLR